MLELGCLHLKKLFLLAFNVHVVQQILVVLSVYTITAR